MKINVLVSLSFMSVFAVSCAHNRIEEDTTKSVQEVSPKFLKEEVKTDKISKNENKSNDLSISCLHGKDSRIITIQKGDKRCEVHYTKNGQLNQVAWGEKNPTICSDVFQNVRSNLEKGNFKCLTNETTAGL